MFKKKEIAIIIFLLALTLILSFYPSFEFLFDNSKENNFFTSDSEYVTITIEGEIIVDEYSIVLPYGSSYGNLIKYLKNITNDYSIIESYTSECFLEDTTIIIKSSDINNTNMEITENKININTSSKEDLIKIYGIGEKRAIKIINYRNSNKIKSFEELKSIIGVSNEIIEKIKEQAVL